MICHCLLIILGFQTPLILASETICFEKSVAQKLLTELEYDKITNEKLDVCFGLYSTNQQIIKIDKSRIEGLKKDKIDITNAKEEFKRDYILTNNQLKKCEETKPSRLNWFGVGSLTTLVLIILSVFTLK